MPDNGTMPLPPHPSLHLSVPLSDSDADGLRSAADEGDEEDELIVLDPEHVKAVSPLNITANVVLNTLRFKPRHAYQTNVLLCFLPSACSR